MTLAVLTEVANLIDERWKAKDFAEPYFGELAARVFEESALHRVFTPKSLLEASLDAEMREDRVAEHPASGVIGLVRTPRFSMLGHFWLDELATIHHHPWDGAFQVISGESAEARYHFEESCRSTRAFRMGVLKRQSVTKRRPGDAVVVNAGPSTIHGIAHLDPICASISARASNKAHLSTNYLRPGIWFLDGSSPVLARHWKKVMKLLARTDAPLEALVEKLLVGSDLETAFHVVREALIATGDKALAQRLCTAAQARHGDAFAAISRSLDDLARARMVRKAREQLAAREHRTMLAVLYLAEEKADLERLLRQLEPDVDVNAAMRDWLLKVFSGERRLFGIHFDESWKRALDDLLSGQATVASDSVIHTAIQRIPLLEALFRTPDESSNMARTWGQLMSHAKARFA